MVDSYFLKLAQKYGLAAVPQTPEQLFTALQGIMTPAQMELVQYLFTDPLEFGTNNPFAAVTNADPIPLATEEPAPTDVLPGKDAANKAVNPALADPAQPSQAGGGPAPVAPQAPVAGSAGFYGGNSGFDPSGKLRLAWDDPDAPALMAKYPGRYVMQPAPAGSTPPATTAPAAGTTAPAAGTVVRPWVPPIQPPPAGSVGTPTTGANAKGESGYWDPGDATHPPRFIKSS